MRRYALSLVPASLVFAIGIAIGSHASLAAERALKAPAPAAADNWSGFYVGGHLGYGWSAANWTNVENSQGVGGFGDSVPPDSFNHRLSGVIGGGQIGFNYQRGAWVFGLEALLAGSSIKGDHASTFGAADDQLTARIDTLVLGTGRLGYAWDRLLAYGKAGVAAARIRASVSDAVGPNTGSGSDAAWQYRPTFGLGLEYGITANVSVAVEYNYIRLGTRTYQLGDATGRYAWDIDIRNVNLLMAKLNYRFK
ncbi:MAG: porin family protein [Rhizobiales bacterium]|nr:porin family protein [Hyphomicrobiales bacterium]